MINASNANRKRGILFTIYGPIKKSSVAFLSTQTMISTILMLCLASELGFQVGEGLGEQNAGDSGHPGGLEGGQVMWYVFIRILRDFFQ